MKVPLSRLVAVWIRDLAIAYAAGLVVGAPLATAVVWGTGRRSLVTPIIVISMVAMLYWRRRITMRDCAHVGRRDAGSRLGVAKQGCPAM
ncbi:MAG TPA: hypothetical protein VMF13_15660 [Luteitalea sp.]|nr:hypothetical protein [Luteitalea sp.]